MQTDCFSSVFLFPEKGAIFPPLTSGVPFVAVSFFSVILLAGVSVVGSLGFLCPSRASKNCLAGALSSGIV